MKVAIIGTGLIGGSIGLALKQARPDVEVVACDLDEAAAARAVERGAADSHTTSVEEAARGSGIIFVATPVGSIPSVVARAASVAAPGAVLTDVGSTKSRVVVEVDGSLPPGVSFIGGHPMAGTEHEGIDAAEAELFRGAWWVLTPTERSDDDAFRRLHAVVTALGARVLAVTPEEHDELVAFVSHVPHLTATALMNMVAERGERHEGLLALAAGGFRDVTRVAASNPQIWLDICEQNSDAIAGALGRFAGNLLEVRDLVERRDRARLEHLFLSARAARRALPSKVVEGDLFEVRMPVPDRPGVLAEVTTSIGDIGINIEDLGLSHSAEGGRGTLVLAIIGRQEADRVAETLRKKGYDTSVVDV